MKANLYDSINNTYSWDALKCNPNPFLWLGTPPRRYGPADPVREWSPYYGAPGYDVETRSPVILDQKGSDYLPRGLQPQTGVNPWDYLYGPIGGMAGYGIGGARVFKSQAGRVSMV